MSYGHKKNRNRIFKGKRKQYNITYVHFHSILFVINSINSINGKENMQNRFFIIMPSFIQIEIYILLSFKSSLTTNFTQHYFEKYSIDISVLLMK